MSDKQLEAVHTQMREAAKRTLKIQEDELSRDQDAHIDSMKTNDVHVGKASQEDDKDQEMEDRKVDKRSITGDRPVRTAPLRTRGETTDEVTTSPEGARPGGGGHPSPDMLQRAAAAASGDPTGGSPEGAETKRSRSRKSKRNRR